ncbi:copper homeostasis periplasmic binding protein CopC [Providencia sp. PROV188]|jgi:methionine-rich copper-binding protein CopC|uniref:copper homeostasis periplasmic binding protein CopC n=1 Tax=Providencia TaxID=586 RepID=UPI0003E1D480|nr:MULTISPECIES: copper homeostasis periplasmic binding protein CopC [Providencia]ETS99086.1 putative copper resistance protein C [Providencia alcalifaciens PAL-3]EUD01214.1 putative copper resistance protein C [Providencia alcalifaciens PAL-1]MBS0925453.1 copper homeostasis periplasmic binding protein CopC [Providencia sp. JGM181]MBS0932727.1 copper homeostasis periplasmic binding protein CopC [Providencia sp. JGM172]MBS0996920.1 copper homeostasis periplasmic binding protein CopC [Providenci
MPINQIKSSWRKLSAVAVLFLGMSFQQAFAHAHLKDQLPAEGAALEQAPEAITLNFSEGIEVNFTKVNVTDENKQIIKTGKAALDPSNNTKVIIPVESKLAAGKYDVQWSVVSVDGHKTKGNYSFTVK